jgi:hypothetical protein
VGKRSPILGYNHNVRYRGLVFHVQTEDSGILSPHLFTHLFHHGVIVSTRKLVYDAGSAEESIKSLMQAQHKAVLKDLRRGHFDDKIDSYLGGTPGLLPRDADEVVERPSEVDLAPSQGTVDASAAATPTEVVLPVFEDQSVPVVIIEEPAASRTISSPLPAALATAAQTSTLPPTPAAVATQASTLPPPTPSRAPTPTPARPRPALPFARSTPAAVDTTLKTEPPAFDSSPEIDLSPDIEIQVEVDDGQDAIPATRRQILEPEARLALENSRPTIDDHGRPPHGVVSEEAKRAATISDGIPAPIRPSSPTIPPLPATDTRRSGDRQSINAAALPPARPISRPLGKPAMTPPQVVSRPLVSDDRSRRESEAVEVYSPAPPSAELPPGERPGQYAQHKKVSTRIPIEGLTKERSGGVPVPAGLGPPRRAGSPQAPISAKPTVPLPPTGSAPSAVPREAPRSSGHTEPLRGRAATSQRTSTPVRTSAHAGSGVVMTRPAVIVGAPAKTSGTIPRIRKAREDEGRGFGQGLISEKSLDEVILAYLSEDADEK